MISNIIDGRESAQILKNNIKKEVSILKNQHDISPKIAVLLVGDDQASNIYVSAKEKQAKEVGIDSIKIKLNKNITQNDLILEIKKLNIDDSINAILVQLPLPKHIDPNEIIFSIDPKKDVDGFHIENVGKLTIGGYNKNKNSIIIPCTALGCAHLIEKIEKNISGKNILIIGSSNIVGMPLSRLLMAKKATVTIANSATKNLKFLCQNSEIIISATGVVNLITKDMVNKNHIIIDVGINRINLKDGKTKLVGDVDFDNIYPIVRAITPVPGGVGPMTIAYLLKNCLELFKNQNNIDIVTKYER
jgi:methylenetetrahydrofolate dehydrogenase (NADP+)/methenyltetrahydrofolate cyclohydrolase